MYKFGGEPCRNFCILGGTAITDAMDGREKLALCSFVSRGTGILILIDVQNGCGEKIELPGDEGAWALLCPDNERLLVGTCGSKGYLHCLDLETRMWKLPLRVESETYIWNLVKASDGMIYGGTYPGCLLVRYDIERHCIEALGRMSDNEGNMYCRDVFGDIGGKLFINCGYEKKHVTVYDIYKESIVQVFEEGSWVEQLAEEFACINSNGNREFFNPYTFEKLEYGLYVNKLRKKDERLDKYSREMAALKDGSLAGIKGQEYFILHKEDSAPSYKGIPVEPPATGILSMTCDEKGNVWGSTNFGQTIFRFDPVSGKYWNSSSVCRNSGEVYGIRTFGGKVFMAAYAGGDHIVFDPSKPWSRAGNINPRELKPAGPKLIRPCGKSIIGPDNAFWTGWMAQYGVYGGGISRVDTGSLEVDIWYDPIPGQSVVGMASGEEFIYFITGGNANGLQTILQSLHLCAWDTGGREIVRIQFPYGAKPQNIATAGNKLAVSFNSDIRLYDSRTLDCLSVIDLGKTCSCMVGYDKNSIMVFADDECILLDTQTGSISRVCRLPGLVGCAASGMNGAVYFACGKELYEVIPDR